MRPSLISTGPTRGPLPDRTARRVMAAPLGAGLMTLSMLAIVSNDSAVAAIDPAAVTDDLHPG